MYQKQGKLTEELSLEESLLGLGKVPKRLLPDQVTSMVCGYCATGCSLDVHIKDGKAVNLTPTKGYPVNMGEACPKGWEALTPLKASDRAVTPSLRNKSGKLREVDWDQALSTFVNRFKGIQEKYGKESVAFLSTGQIPTEEMALLGSLAKFGMGIKHGDGNTRQCMATAAVAYKQSFGFDAPPYTYKDFEESDVLVFIGANPCIAHPIMWERVCRNTNNPKIIVIDPRKTETAMAATHHYALNPKSDLTLFYGIASMLIKNNWVNGKYVREYTQGFKEFQNHVGAFPSSHVSEATGLSIEKLEELCKIIYEGKRVSFWWTMGINQGHEGVRSAQAIINIALMTGNMGRPGTGANSITGQCNAMGSRIFSNTTGLLGGHDFLNHSHRQKIASILNINPNKIPNENSLAYDQIIEKIASHKIKGLWVIATNPGHSWIHQKGFREIIKNLDFLVVQDMYHTTEMAEQADLILPAAGWGEKEGTFINSERRVGLIKKVAKAPGQALADFHIFKLIARYWGCADIFEEWKTPEAVFQILKKISKDMPCDITGIKDYKMLEDYGGIQWPFPEKDEAVQFSYPEIRERRLFCDGKYYHPDGKAKFLFSDVLPIPEATNAKYPFVLLTGRGSSSQWHTQTRTGKCAVLRKMYPQDIYVEINSEDALKLNIEQNQLVRVSTQRAKIKARASVVPTVAPGQIFIPMHYPETNQLTFPVFDPHSRQPSYKHCAANVEHLPYYR